LRYLTDAQRRGRPVFIAILRTVGGRASAIVEPPSQTSAGSLVRTLRQLTLPLTAHANYFVLSTTRVAQTILSVCLQAVCIPTPSASWRLCVRLALPLSVISSRSGQDDHAPFFITHFSSHPIRSVRADPDAE